MYKDDLMTLQECMLEVLDNPKEKRIIVETNIPSLGHIGETIYYMIDKSTDCGDTVIKGLEWQVTNNEGAGTEAPDNRSVILLGNYIQIYTIGPKVQNKSEIFSLALISRKFIPEI